MGNMFVKTSLRLSVALALLILSLCAAAQGDSLRAENYKLMELGVDTLPSLNIARTGHATFCLDGELTVFGGHTHGFIPTSTAEYYRDGVWHTVPMVYLHDNATALRLRSGKVFLAGGHKDPLGIGQLFSAEMYDPKSHTTQGLGCMDRKRAYASAIEMADGQVVIAGNWYANDSIEMFGNVYDPTHVNAIGVKDVSFARATPYILRIADDDAIIFGSLDNKGNPADGSIIDRLNDQAYSEPFLDTWRPLPTINVHRSYNQFIGDEAEGSYEWLVPVENDEIGKVAIARVKGSGDKGTTPTFALLPTEQPIPDSIQGRHIIYGSLVCDRQRGIAYLIGNDDEARIIVIAISYDTPGSSPLTIYFTAPQPILAKETTPVLTPEGDLVFAGGQRHNNFSPSAAVVRIPLGSLAATADVSAATADSGSKVVWLWIVLICTASGIIVAFVTVRLKRSKVSIPSACEPTALVTEAVEEDPVDKNIQKDDVLVDLFARIERLMEAENLYLNANLRASDVAARVGSNIAYVSAAINSQLGYSFTQYLTTYRIAYAQKLMRENPDSKISVISAHSGFTTDSTFFRAFRSVTGMSPKEWLSGVNDNERQK